MFIEERLEALQPLLEQFFEHPSHETLGTIIQEFPIPEMSSMWHTLPVKEQRTLFLSFSLHQRVELLEHLTIEDQLSLIKSLPIANVQALISLIEPEDLVDIFQVLPDEVRSQLWDSLDEKSKKEMIFLLRFDHDDAAGIMTPRYLAVRKTITVKQCLRFVRNNASDLRTLYYVYIVDEFRRIVGVLSLRNLLIYETNMPDTSLSELMETKVISVQEDTDQEEVVQIMERYTLLYIPVIDKLNRILGIVTIHEALHVLRLEQTEDVYKMGAMEGSAEKYLTSNVWNLVLKRIPWLILLLLAGTLTTNLLSAFQPLMESAIFLIWFLPVITQTGGNISTQSSTLLIRGIARNEVSFANISQVFRKESKVAIILAFLLSVVIMLRGMYFPPGLSFQQAVAISAALFFVSIFSALIGALSPLIIARFRLDPTVMTGPLMGTIIDLVGMSLYFSIASLIHSVILV